MRRRPISPAWSDRPTSTRSPSQQRGRRATRSSRWCRCCATGLARSDDEAAPWLHRGLTSQDVVDTALMLCLRDALDRVEAELREQVSALSPPRRRAPVDGDGRPDPDPARGPDLVRAQGVRVAHGCPRRRRRGRSVRVPRWPPRSAEPPEPWPRRPSWRAPRLWPTPSAVAVATADGLAAALGLGRPAAVAHLATPGHPHRRRARGGDRRLGTDRVRRGDVGAAGDRRAGRAGRRRPRGLVDDAAEAEPGAVRAGPPGRADGTWPRRHAPHRRGAGRRRAAGRCLARRMGDAANPRPADRRRRFADDRAGLRAPGGRSTAWRKPLPSLGMR